MERKRTGCFQNFRPMLYDIKVKRRELTQHVQNQSYEELVWSKNW
jgi:hypothetical protein